MANNKYTVMSEEAIRYICGLIRNLANVSEGINNTNLADDKVFSNLYTKKLIDKCLEDANTEAQKLVGALTHLTCEKTTVQPTLDNSQINVIYLYSADGNAPFQQYLKISETELIDMGSTTISLTNYLTATQIASAYVKQIDFETLTTSFNNLVTSVDGKIDKDKIVTVLDDSVTDEDIASAKAVYNATVDKNIKTYTSLEPLGLTTPTTTGEIFNAMPNDSICRIANSNYNKVSDTPTDYGILKIDKNNMYSYDIEFKRSKSNIVTGNYLWIGQLRGDNGSGLLWQRVCTSSVEDVEETKIEIDETALGLTIADNKSLYKVINGICYVTFEVNVVPPTDDKTYRYIKINTTRLPKIGFSTKAVLNVIETSSSISVVLDKGSTDLKLHGNIRGREGSCIIQGSFSYPVAE